MTDNEHHVFCNFFTKPFPCDMCDRLYKAYPYKVGEDPMRAGDRIMKESFPDVIVKSNIIEEKEG